MITLAIRTDKVTAELYLFEDTIEIGRIVWEAHRILADSLLNKIEELCKQSKIVYTDISKIAVYQGPGSFTGLRIGISVANSLSYGLDILLVSARGEEWLDACLGDAEEQLKFVTPYYGSEPTITAQKK